MRFGPVPLEESEGRILAHNVSDETGRRVLRKGRSLEASAIDLLRGLGFESVYVAELEDGDVHEDEAAERISRVVRGDHLTASRPHAGRVNLTAPTVGVLRVDASRLLALNSIEGVTIATLPSNATVRAGARVATVKVIPYALPAEAVARAESIEPPKSATQASSGETDRTWGGRGVVSLEPIPAREVSIVLVGSPGARKSLEEGIGAAIRGRIESLGCTIAAVTFSRADERLLADTLAEAPTKELIVVAGETAIMDPDDLIPRGLRLAGGRVELLGLPMDPGQLLLLGYLDDTPVVGAPGCVRGTLPDGFDAIVPRLLVGERLGGDDLRALGHGGLLAEPRGRTR